jgi:hypothetical protein
MKPIHHSFTSLHSPDPYKESICESTSAQIQNKQPVKQPEVAKSISDSDYLNFMIQSQKEILELLKKIAQKF